MFPNKDLMFIEYQPFAFVEKEIEGFANTTNKTEDVKSISVSTASKLASLISLVTNITRNKTICDSYLQELRKLQYIDDQLLNSKYKTDLTSINSKISGLTETIRLSNEIVILANTEMGIINMSIPKNDIRKAKSSSNKVTDYLNRIKNFDIDSAKIPSLVFTNVANILSDFYPMKVTEIKGYAEVTYNNADLINKELVKIEEFMKTISLPNTEDFNINDKIISCKKYFQVIQTFRDKTNTAASKIPTIPTIVVVADIRKLDNLYTELVSFNFEDKVIQLTKETIEVIRQQIIIILSNSIVNNSEFKNTLEENISIVKKTYDELAKIKDAKLGYLAEDEYEEVSKIIKELEDKKVELETKINQMKNYFNNISTSEKFYEVIKSRDTQFDVEDIIKIRTKIIDLNELNKYREEVNNFTNSTNNYTNTVKSNIESIKDKIEEFKKNANKEIDDMSTKVNNLAEETKTYINTKLSTDYRDLVGLRNDTVAVVLSISDNIEKAKEINSSKIINEMIENTSSQTKLFLEKNTEIMSLVKELKKYLTDVDKANNNFDLILIENTKKEFDEKIRILQEKGKTIEDLRQTIEGLSLNTFQKAKELRKRKIIIISSSVTVSIIILTIILFIIFRKEETPTF